MTLAVNVTDRDACFDAVAKVTQHFGRVDVLVNNAGVYRSKTFLDYSPQDFQDMLDVNLFGVLNFMQACLPGMQERRHGRIINMASTAGKWGSRNQSAYNVSKHAVVGVTRCVALEASPYAVTVNAICPGFIQTDMVEELKAHGQGGFNKSALRSCSKPFRNCGIGRLFGFCRIKRHDGSVYSRRWRHGFKLKAIFQTLGRRNSG
jgi:NAD(P)-dependent dehydrogenase (short-subunit alcohol dehydrogenase family)